MSAGYALHPAGTWYLHHPHRPKNRRRLFFGGRGGGCFRSRGGLTRSRLPSLVGWKSRLCKSGIRRGTVVSPDRVRALRAMCRAVSKHGVYAGRALSTSLSSFWGTVRLAPGWSGGLGQPLGARLVGLCGAGLWLCRVCARCFANLVCVWQGCVWARQGTVSKNEGYGA